MEQIRVYFDAALASLPPLPVWSYWLAAALAAVSVLSYLFHRRRRNRLRFAALARSQALRRQVYLPAAAAIARAQTALVRVAGAGWTREQGAVVADEIGVALGRLQLSADTQVLKPVMAVSTQFAIAQLILAGRRRPLDELKRRIDRLEGRISHLSSQRDRLLTQLSCLAGAAAPEQRRWDELTTRFDSLDRRIEQSLDERDAKLTQYSRLCHGLLLEAVERSLRIVRLAVPAYLALREQQGLAGDAEQYRALAQDHIAELEQTLQRLKTADARGYSAESGRPAAELSAVS